MKRSFNFCMQLSDICAPGAQDGLCLYLNGAFALPQDWKERDRDDILHRRPEYLNMPTTLWKQGSSVEVNGSLCSTCQPV